MRKGQATVEFALLVPFIFAFLFLVIELGFFFGDTMYVTYAAFAGARAQQVGEDASDATDLLLDGNMTRTATVSASRSRGTVTVRHRWPTSLPFVNQIVSNLDFDVTVVAGPNEEDYEGRSGALPSRYADNNCRGRC